MKDKRAPLAGALLAVLIAATAVFASSCGEKQERKEEPAVEEPVVQVEVTDRSDLDSLLQDLDASMNSISADDFSDSQLSDAELGL